MYGHRVGINKRRQGSNHPLPLQLSQQANRRAPANLRVLARNRNRAPRGNQFGDWPPQESQRPQRNYVGIEKQVQQERLDGLQRIRPPKLKQHNSDSLLPCHATFTASATSSSAQPPGAR